MLVLNWKHAELDKCYWLSNIKMQMRLTTYILLFGQSPIYSPAVRNSHSDMKVQSNIYCMHTKYNILNYLVKLFEADCNILPLLAVSTPEIFPNLYETQKCLKQKEKEGKKGC